MSPSSEQDGVGAAPQNQLRINRPKTREKADKGKLN
jgi:hypothetical protein